MIEAGDAGTDERKKYLNITGKGQRRVILKRIRDVQKYAALRDGCLAVVLAGRSKGGMDL